MIGDLRTGIREGDYTTMKNMIFISRHTPTVEQVALADAQGYRLVHVGDVDAFDGPAVAALIGDAPQCNGNYIDAVCCVHPAIAIAAIAAGKAVGIFENANRAAEGEKPSFYPKALHTYGDACAQELNLYVRTTVGE